MHGGFLVIYCKFGVLPRGQRGVCLEPVQRIVRVRKSHCAGSRAKEDKEAQQQELSRAFGGFRSLHAGAGRRRGCCGRILAGAVDTAVSCAPPPHFAQLGRAVYFLSGVSLLLFFNLHKLKNRENDKSVTVYGRCSRQDNARRKIFVLHGPPSPVCSPGIQGVALIDIVLGSVLWTTLREKLLKHLAVKFMGNCVS